MSDYTDEEIGTYDVKRICEEIRAAYSVTPADECGPALLSWWHELREDQRPNKMAMYKHLERQDPGICAAVRLHNALARKAGARGVRVDSRPERKTRGLR
jgi:hypothetical protein